MICLWFGRDPFPKFMPLPWNSLRPVSGGPGVWKLSPLRALSAPELPGGWLRPLLRMPGSSASPSAQCCLEEPLHGYRPWAHSPKELRQANPSEPASRDANLGQSRISAFGPSLHAHGKIFLALMVFRPEDLTFLSVDMKASYLKLWLTS